MKYIKIMAIILTFLLIYLVGSRNGSLSKLPSSHLSQKNMEDKYDKKEVTLHKSKRRKSQKSIEDTSDNEVYQLLQSPSNDDLEYVWEDEYGCWNSDKCKYDWLNAKSLEEALWMRNNGYPTVSMLRLINDDRYKDELAELTRRKFPAALAVATISAMENGNFKEGFNFALSNVARSNNSQIYPHYLLGEALLANDMKPLAISQFYIAGILGDPLANGRAMALSPDVPFSTTALNSAHKYISRVFGTEVPNDPRPDGG
jgi:hypothetical protein